MHMQASNRRTPQECIDTSSGANILLEHSRSQFMIVIDRIDEQLAIIDGIRGQHSVQESAYPHTYNMCDDPRMSLTLPASAMDQRKSGTYGDHKTTLISQFYSFLPAYSHTLATDKHSVGDLSQALTAAEDFSGRIRALTVLIPDMQQHLDTLTLQWGKIIATEQQHQMETAS